MAENKTMDHSKLMANRKLNLAYILAGAAAQGFELAEKAMDWASLDLVQSNKQIVKEINRTLNKLIWLVEELNRKSVLTMNEVDSSKFEDTLHIYFVLFMQIIDKAGLDELSLYRLYNIYHLLDKYKSLMNYPFKGIKEDMAFRWILEFAKDSKFLHIDQQGNIMSVQEDGKKSQLLKLK